EIETQPRFQFIIEMSVFIFIGIFIMLFNTLVYRFPLGSGVKVIVGAVCASFFVGTDMSLERERELFFQIQTRRINADSSKSGIARTFAGFSTAAVLLMAAVILLVVAKDYRWVYGLPKEKLSNGILLSLLELFFVLVVFLLWIINLIFSFSKNLKMFFSGEALALRSAMEGRFDTFVPVVRSDEFGTIASYTNEMILELQEKKRIREIFGKIVSPEVSRRLLSGGVSLDGKEERLVILFSDVRNFTSISENFPPAVLIKNLNRYLTEMVKIVYKYGGEVDKFIGDGILAYFGLEENNDNFIKNALSASLEMLSRSRELKSELEIPLEIGIGMDYGDVIAGAVGSLERLEFTVIGNPVNSASRLEGLTKELGSPLVISEKLHQNLAFHSDLFIEKGEFRLKGKAQMEKVYVLK
ncbi:MAG TPA: adenylate/guanylate cyclase domain-containing protein, partial [Leptospiraceae bacterium]|nr:adenylate/guanylate cyclase domain-containing protein [Leptospiraceae bacterium]